MTRRGLVLCLLLLIVALVFTANRIAERILDERLPPLLTDVLGIPVSLAPIDADLVTLTASTVTGNTSADDGGGIRTSENLARLDVAVTWNEATGDGGGIFSDAKANSTATAATSSTSLSRWIADSRANQASSSS